MRAIRAALLSAFLYLFIACVASANDEINESSNDNDSKDISAESPFANIPDERLIALFVYPPINDSDIFVVELQPVPTVFSELDRRRYWFGSDIFPVTEGTDIEAARFSGGPIGAHVECTIFTAPVELRDGVWELVDADSDLGQKKTFSYGETVAMEGATGFCCSAVFYGDQNPGMKPEE